MTTPTTVHALCLDLARESTSKVERYLLLRLAMQAERVDLIGVLNSPAVFALVTNVAPFLGALLIQMVTPKAAASTAPAN